MLKFTKKDKIILRIFEVDARATLQKIGRLAHLSPEAAAYRIDRLRRIGAILRFHAVINYFRAGFVKHKLYLRLRPPNQKIAEEICEYFRKGGKTEWVAQCSGRWDVIAGFVVSNANEFDSEIAKFLDKHSRHVLEKAVTQTLYLAHQPRTGLVEEEGESTGKKIVYHTSLDKKVELDKIDLAILRIIANNARMSINRIASLAKTSPKTAAYRMSKMEKEGVILEYKAHLDPKAFGRSFYKLLLNLHSIDSATQNRIMEYCGHLPNVAWPQRVLGSWDLEIDLDCEGEEMMNWMLSQIYEKFPEVVADHAIAYQVKEYKLDLFPGAMPQEDAKP